MKIKWVKTFGGIMALLLLAMVASWYLVTYRFKEALQYIVKTESNSTYELNIHSLDFSFLKKSVVVKEAQLAPSDTTGLDTRYDVRIPSIFFSIKSWTQILFKAQVAVDSFSIDFPQISIHDYNKDKPQKKRITVHASDIFDKLQEVKSHLSVRSFTLVNAAFTYGSVRDPGKFHSNRINFSVKNFAVEDSGQHFLTSEHVLLDIADQEWNFPSNRHQVQFKQLLLSGEDRVFRIDSCTFTGLDKYDRSFSVTVDRLLFSSDNLNALYEKDELIIDSLLLTRPIVTIPTSEKQVRLPTSDTGHVISTAIREMFPSIQVKYIHIDSGMVFLADNKGVKSLSDNGTDIKIYNLVIDEDDTPISTDSIILSQQKIAFVTKNGLFKLNIERFLLKDNSLYLSDVVFGPTPQNREPKIFTFKAPSMMLKNIDLEELMEKKISAEAAELLHPEIVFVDNKGKNKPKGEDNKAAKIERFYTALNAVNELMDVKWFHIKDGNVIYRAFGDEASYARLDDIDIEIRLNDFAASDDWVDIERSVRRFATKKIMLYSPALSIHLDRFQLTGGLRKATVDAFHIQAGDDKEKRIMGKQLAWSGINWNRLLKGNLQLETFRVKEIAVDLSPSGQASQETPISLPTVDINRMTIDAVAFKSTMGGSVRFKGNNVTVHKVRSQEKKIQWKDASVNLDSFYLSHNATTVSVQHVRFSSEGGSECRDIHITHASEEADVEVQIPLVQSTVPLRSTDVNEMRVKDLLLDRPQVLLLQKDSGKKDSGGSFSLPNVALDLLVVNAATVAYQHAAKKATAASVVSIRAENLSTDTANGILARQLNATLSSLQFENEKLSFFFPQFESGVKNASLLLSNEKYFSGIVSGNWKQGKLRLQHPDSTSLEVAGIGGDIKETMVHFTQKDQSIDEILGSIVVGTGPIQYYGKKTGVECAFIKWKPANRELEAGPFSIKPLLDEKTYFEKQGWQSEYVTVSGGAVVLQQLRYGVAAPTSITAGNMLLKDVLITTFRDKTLPLPEHISKLMFGQMLEKISIPVAADTITLDNGKVIVDVLSAFTGKRASIPIDELNATVTGFSNFDNGADSLTIVGSLKLYNTKAHEIVYKEAHRDSLYGFSLHLNASSIALPELSEITLPFGNVVLASGQADTLFANWRGNKYGAVGKMHFYYDGLKVKLVKSTDTAKTGLGRRLLSLFVNDVVIHKKNSRPSYVFYIRDTRKSVFNYWVKTLLSGALSSSVIYQEKKLRKKYDKHKAQLMLPFYPYSSTGF